MPESGRPSSRGRLTWSSDSRGNESRARSLPRRRRPTCKESSRRAVIRGSFLGRGANLASVPYTAREARQELLDTLGDAVDEIAVALAALGGAYEQLTTLPAERLEEELFRPVQAAYGRAKRTHAGFAQRQGLPARTFTPASPGRPSTGIRGFVDNAVDSVAEADAELAELQDSMMPVEVGDAELRAGLAEVRELLGGVRARAREFVRTLGR